MTPKPSSETDLLGPTLSGARVVVEREFDGAGGGRGFDVMAKDDSGVYAVLYMRLGLGLGVVSNPRSNERHCIVWSMNVFRTCVREREREQF
jgi:hypothetical protein